MKAKYVLIVSYFYILLFVYAAISKLITFEAFQVQLTQSPLLSAYANSIAYLVLGAELLFALLLCIKTTRLTGLYLSYGLMVAFTLYIYLILNYSDFIPCSCGGILEKMGWNEHLWFNIIVSLLALIALFFHDQKRKRFYIGSITTTIISSILVILLFLSSEYIIKKENPFIRRYLPHGVLEDDTLELQVNSFYFSGYYKDNIYLGNYNTPLRYIRVDSLLQREDFSIEIDSINFAYSDLRLKVSYPFFYIADGTIPIVFQGVLDNQIASAKTKVLSYREVYFLDFLPLDSTHIIFKSIDINQKRIILGTIDLNKNNKIDLKQDLLKIESDGVFDIDGVLNYSVKQKKVFYTYYYRNRFVEMDNYLNFIKEHKTIDTTSSVKITAAKLSTGENKMTTPIQAINSKVLTHGNLFFIVSNSMGQKESYKMWGRASIIDVYDIVEDNYVGSFYINNLGEYKLSDMIVTDNYIYGLFDTKLVRFKLAKLLRDKF
ncbi:DoxX family protein [Myroides injenensis]|uniref:DoxX family protein n=1 Tax=Myroides injenensis TaxID=1183151 RepID=UPI0002D7934A|nr:MauE/DoxX family redox-associated membrane protein [Myroides injenensis]